MAVTQLALLVVTEEQVWLIVLPVVVLREREAVEVPLLVRGLPVLAARAEAVTQPTTPLRVVLVLQTQVQAEAGAEMPLALHTVTAAMAAQAL